MTGADPPDTMTTFSRSQIGFFISKKFIMEGWHDLFVASAGAAAALMGLLFVGLSINLAKMLSFPLLLNRAMIALILLLSILIQSLLMLVPHETTRFAGICILVIVVLTWPFLSFLDLLIFRKLENQYRNLHVGKMFFNQLAVLPYFVGGIILLNGSVSGSYWLVASIIVSFLKASLDAWVLLVEINR